MQDWDLTSVGLVLIGSSITVAGTIIGVMLLGVRIASCPVPAADHCSTGRVECSPDCIQYAEKPAARCKEVPLMQNSLRCQDLQRPDLEHLGRAGKDS